MASNVAQGSTRLILIGCAVLLSIGMGLRQSIGLFLTPVTRDLALTAADFTLTIAIQNIVWGLSQAPAGAIADRFGVRVTLVAGTVIYIAGFAAMAAADGEMALIVSECADRDRAVVHGLFAGARGLRPGGAGAEPQQDAWCGRGGRLARYAHRTARDPGRAEILRVANRGAFLCGPRRRDAAGRVLGWCLGQASRDGGGSEDDDARYARPGAAPSRLSGYVGRVFRLRTEPCLSYDTLTGVPGDLRPGPDAERRGAGGHRRRQLRRCLAGGLARRPLSEARRVGLALYPAVGCIRRLLRGSADGDQHAGLCGGDGPAVVPWGVAAPKRPGRRDVRHSLHGDAPRDLLRRAPGRRFARSVGRRHHFRCNRIL